MTATTPYVLVFILLVALIGFLRWRPGLALSMPSINWRWVGYSALAIVIVAAIAAATHHYRYQNAETAAPPAVSTQGQGITTGTDWTALFWTLGIVAAVVVGLILFALFVRWAWRRPPAAGGAPLFPDWLKRVLFWVLLAALVVAAIFLPWQQWLPIEWQPYAPAQWPSLMRASVASWTPQTQAALVLLALAAVLLYFFSKRKWAAALALLALLILLLPPSATEDNWSDKVSTALNNRCHNSDWTQTTLTTSLLDINNKDGHCRVDIRQEGAGCIFIKRYNGEEKGPFCPGMKTVVLPKNMVALRSTSGPIEVSYKLYPP